MNKTISRDHTTLLMVLSELCCHATAVLGIGPPGNFMYATCAGSVLRIIDYMLFIVKGLYGMVWCCRQ